MLMPVHCRRCNYPLRGLPAQTCPECGCEFDPADPSTFGGRPGKRLAGPLWTLSAAVGVAALLLVAVFSILHVGNRAAYELRFALLGCIGLVLMILSVSAFAFATRTPPPTKWDYSTIGIIAAILALLTLWSVPAIA